MAYEEKIVLMSASRHDNPWADPKPTEKTGRKQKSKRKMKRGRGKPPSRPSQSWLSRLFHAFHDDPSPYKTFCILASLLLIMWLSTGFYRIQPGDRPLILHLGEFTQTVSEPGLHYRLPYPVVTVTQKSDAKNDPKCDGTLSDTGV